MEKKWHIPRRTFLRGLGVSVALPMFEAMLPATSSAAGAMAAPRRMAFIYVPNGKNMEDWTPRAVGANYDMPSILEPLKPYQKDLSVLSGLAQVHARSNGDGPGDHARANATFLTGVQARKTAGADVRLGISVDQMAASKIGRQTRYASLELGCDKSRNAGSCDSGYSCIYQHNISWKTDTTPMPPEANPRVVFERLFGANGRDAVENRARRERYNKSILDFVLEDAQQLKANLGTTDQRKLDEYMTAVREMEQQIEQAERFAASQPKPTINKPEGIPSDYAQHVRLMYDLLALAFQTDSTRVATFMVAHDGSNRSYPQIGVPEGHHDLSHHGNDPGKKAKIARINKFHTTNFAYFLNKLKSIREASGTLLDNSMIVYGSGIADGNRHAHHDLPVLLAGGGGGTIRPGRHIKYESLTPMTNLYLSLLERVGAPVERLGDSTGKLGQLT